MRQYYSQILRMYVARILLYICRDTKTVDLNLA